MGRKPKLHTKKRVYKVVGITIWVTPAQMMDWMEFVAECGAPASAVGRRILEKAGAIRPMNMPPPGGPIPPPSVTPE